MSEPRRGRTTAAVLIAALIALGAGCSDDSKGAMKSPEETRKEAKPEPKSTEPLPEIPPAEPPKEPEPAPAPPAEEPAPAPAPAEEKPAEPPAEQPNTPLPAEADVTYSCESCGKEQALAATAAVPTCCGNPMKAKP